MLTINTIRLTNLFHRNVAFVVKKIVPQKSSIFVDDIIKLFNKNIYLCPPSQSTK